MAKNKTKNNKSKRNKQSNIRRELIFREAGQEYAQVTKMLGNCRVTAYCFDGISRMCQIRGSMRKKVMIQLGDIILIGLREYQNDKADIILKYSPEEARLLVSYEELPPTTKLHEKLTGQPADPEDDIPFKFTEEASDASDDSDSKSINKSKISSKSTSILNEYSEDSGESDIDLDTL